MADIICEPDPNLLESMRSVGYDLNTAVADLIDNSIAANASTIDIVYNDFGEQPYIAIIDDGDGMNRDMAVQSMQLAGNSPEMTRKATDLGRFGLGLKTASLSQARSLLVVSRKARIQTSLRWDLDAVARKREWALEELSKDDTDAALPEKVRNLIPSVHGTCVLWRKMDRLESVFGNKLSDLDVAITDMMNYLALVFHRFTHPYPDDPIKKTTIRVNGMAIPHRDPFLTNNPAVQQQAPQVVAGTEVILRGYTLPYQNKLTDEDRALLDLGHEKGKTLLDTQGFYIYRAYRLITWGNWFHMMRREESTKLCRVRIDIPNTLDAEWTLDIKKSTATPPKTVRDSMRRFANSLSKPSRQVHRFRGRKISSDPEAPIWEVVQDRDNAFRYEINSKNPYVSAFEQTLSPEQRHNFKSMVKVLESCFPYRDMHSRIAMDECVQEPLDIDEGITEMATQFWTVQHALGMSSEQFVRLYQDKEPFALSKNAANILKEVTNG